MKRVYVAGLAIMSLALGGCGGSKVLKEEVPGSQVAPLAYSADGSVEVSLDHVVVRDGPGSWARNADWDEYRLRITNLGAAPVSIREVVVHDMRDEALMANDNRRQLVKASRDVADAYEDEGVVVVAGAGTAALVTGGAVSAAVAVGTAAAAPFAGGAAVAGVAAAGLVLAPVLITGGVIKGVNHSRVSQEIEARSTDLPLAVAQGHVAEVTAFFPLTVSPTKVEVFYDEAGQRKSVVVNTRELLAGLHVGEGKPKKKRPYGQTSWAHPND